MFLVSAESKGLSDRVSSLSATLTLEFVSVAPKGLNGGNEWRSENGIWTKGVESSKLKEMTMPRRLDRMRARQWVNEGFRKDEMDRSG